MTELEKRPWHYARDYLVHDNARKEAIKLGIPAAAERHKAAMQAVWDSVPPDLLDMVKDHVSSEREKAKYAGR